MVGRGRERPVGALRQRGLRGLVDDALVADPVRGGDAWRAGEYVGEAPAGDLTCLAQPALDIDKGGEPEVPPAELLVPAPVHPDRPPGRPSQPGRLQGHGAAVLAAEPAAV